MYREIATKGTTGQVVADMPVPEPATATAEGGATAAEASTSPALDRFTGMALVALVVQLGLGIHLRAVLAGMDQPWGSWLFLRQAHSHLGYYGLIFPLVWWAWRRQGLPVPGPLQTAAYALATAAATWGFVQAGYALLSIAASTVVLLVWVIAALRLRRQVKELRSWWAPAVPAILLSAVAIPGVAVTISRDPAFARDLVQAFLTLLMFGVATPAALAQQGARPPLAPAWTIGVLCTAMLLGPWPGLFTHLGAVLLAGLLLWTAWDLPELDQRAAWGGLVLGLLALGTGALPESQPVAIAGLHYAVLGPVLMSLGAALVGRLPLLARLVYLLPVGVLTLAVLLPTWLPDPRWPAIATGAGVGVAAWWLSAIGWRWWGRR